jgi:hypothetical protein
LCELPPVFEFQELSKRGKRDPEFVQNRLRRATETVCKDFEDVALRDLCCEK